MPHIARVVTQISLNREFDYLIPDELTDVVLVGTRVVVPFGRGRTTGTVVGLSDRSEYPELKPILELHGRKTFVTAGILKLARWISDYYCCPIEKVLQTVLPAAVRKTRGDARTRLSVRLTGAPEPGPESARLGPKQKEVLDFLSGRGGGVPLAELTRELGVAAGTVKGLEAKGRVCVEAVESARSPTAHRDILPTQPLVLGAEQQAALNDILQGLPAGAAPGAAVIPRPEGERPPGVILLHGVTGSGKTEVYLQAIAEVIRRGMGAIVLVPEIALTPQTVDRFVGRFGRRVAVLHSHLSEGERHDEWHRVLDGDADIVIGARSAVFAPVARLGLIVVDEEHENSYKQEESPRYNARDVAVMRGHMEPCLVVLGSATPALESWVNVSRGKYRLATLAGRVDGRRMPAIRIVDMRVEAQREGKVGVFSKSLIEAVSDRLHRAEQVILFLNRRGFASSLVCPKCGFTSACGNCSVNMTYHRHDERLRCHLCGDSAAVPKVCPACSDPAFRMAGFGTQRVEAVVTKFFPKAQVARIDTDAVVRKDAYERILGDFRSGRTDILIGTQMIAKGLDFPNVTLVGVLNADMSLHIPDFRAGERTYQLIAQVAGRAGRGDIPGEVIVQTYTPFHPSLQAARRNDYTGFCDQELEFRREWKYPPFAHLVCLHFRGKSEEKVAGVARELAERLGPLLGAGVARGEPTPAPILRIQGQFRYQMILRAPATASITRPLKAVLATFRVPRDVSLAVDVDAVGLL